MQAGYGKEGQWCDRFALVRPSSPQGSPLKTYQQGTGGYQLTFSVEMVLKLQDSIPRTCPENTARASLTYHSMGLSGAV